MCADENIVRKIVCVKSELCVIGFSGIFTLLLLLLPRVPRPTVRATERPSKKNHLTSHVSCYHANRHSCIRPAVSSVQISHSIAVCRLVFIHDDAILKKTHTHTFSHEKNRRTDFSCVKNSLLPTSKSAWRVSVGMLQCCQPCVFPATLGLFWPLSRVFGLMWFFPSLFRNYCDLWAINPPQTLHECHLPTSKPVGWNCPAGCLASEGEWEWPPSFLYPPLSVHPCFLVLRFGHNRDA